MTPEVRRLSPHIERALSLGGLALRDCAGDYRRSDEALLEAFPLDRTRVDGETLVYVEDPDAHGRDDYGPPFDNFMQARILVCRHMRLAFEEGADWLVEVLEPERAEISAQAAYALALEREAGLR